MNNRLRAAVVGCGKIGSEFADDARIRGIYSHAGAYSASERAELIAVCDTDGQRATKAALRWGLAKSYTDVSELLTREAPDIVSVCTPDATHAEVLRKVLSVGQVRGILAEKPLALAVEEAEALVTLADSRNVAIVVGYLRRFSEGHRRARDAIAAGEIGKVQNVTGWYTGGVVHNGSHWFDLMRWMVGEISSVEASGNVHGNRGDPNPSARIVFAGGATGFLHGFGESDFSVFETDIVGSRGRIRLCDSGHRIELYLAQESPHYTGYRSLSAAGVWDGGLSDVMVNAIGNLIDCVAGTAVPQCSGADGIAALRLAQGVMESQMSNRVVAFDIH